GKKITGFQLGNWLDTKSIPYKLRFVGMVRKGISGALSSHVHRIFPMEQVNQAITLYREDMSSGKILIRITPSYKVK
ncbi:MAG: hypothetical protein R6W31_03860, partial [Bacteroidales bacterium]